MKWLLGVAVFCSGCFAASRPTPKITIDMDRLGYAPRPDVSNRELVRHLDAQSLNSFDFNAHLVAVAADELIVYTTRSELPNQPWSASSIRAFFVDTASGKLLRREKWPIRPRTSPSEQTDSEARIFGVEDGRFIVSARDELSLWRANVLLRKYSLDFVFALQIAPDASAVVTRGHLADGTVAYSLLDAATFETRQAFLRAESYGHPFYFGVFRDSLMFKEMDGLHQVNWDGRDRLFCSEPICRDSCGAFAVLQGTAAQQRVAVSSCYGLGVAAVDGGLLWSKTIKQDLGLGHMMFLGVAASSDGRRIVLDVMRGGRGHQDFDGLHLDYDMELLVYDASTGKRLSALPFGSANGDGEFTFSQDGKTLWTFDGKFLRGYSLPE